MSRQVVAAGFIIFRRIQCEIQYLLLQTSYGEHHWTPPKGHVDPGESEFETALRETEEEAGFKKDQLHIYQDFQKILNYEVRGKPKRVVYWVAELADGNTPVTLSHEHQAYKWLNFEESLIYSKFADLQEAMKDVHEFVKNL